MSYLNIIVKKYDRLLLGAIVVLCVFGTVMLFSASSIRSLEITSNRTDTLYLQAHLKRLLVGVIFMFFFMLLDYRKLKDWALYILGGAVSLLVLTLVMNFFQGTAGASRWLYLGISPSKQAILPVWH
jgi:cell division protein FtsW